MEDETKNLSTPIALVLSSLGYSYVLATYMTKGLTRVLFLLPHILPIDHLSLVFHIKSSQRSLIFLYHMDHVFQASPFLLQQRTSHCLQKLLRLCCNCHFSSQDTGKYSPTFNSFLKF